MATPLAAGPLSPSASLGERRAPEEPCPGCGGIIAERHCPRCGERRASERPYTLRELGGEALAEVVQFDSTLLRTLRTVFRSPGALTAAYMRGDRARYTRPVQLFLLANLAFFVLSGPLQVRILDTPLQVHLRATPYRDAATALVQRRVAERKTTLAAYQQEFNAAASVQARSLVIVMVPVFALMVALVNVGRPGNALQHAVFSLHFFTVYFALFLAIAVIAKALALVAGKGAVASADPVLATGTVLATTAYLASAEARVYGTSRTGSAIRGLALALGCLLILGAYRAVLFGTTFLAT